jgi:hypothetical protein
MLMVIANTYLKITGLDERCDSYCRVASFARSTRELEPNKGASHNEKSYQPSLKPRKEIPRPKMKNKIASRTIIRIAGIQRSLKVRPIILVPSHSTTTPIASPVMEQFLS